ncbi:MAG: hypothetical protein ABSE16_20240 [Verrucomicrobiota bacterium]|jgi:hypothetical protein
MKTEMSFPNEKSAHTQPTASAARSKQTAMAVSSSRDEVARARAIYLHLNHCAASILSMRLITEAASSATQAFHEVKHERYDVYSHWGLNEERPNEGSTPSRSMRPLTKSNTKTNTINKSN